MAGNARAQREAGILEAAVPRRNPAKKWRTPRTHREFELTY
jgi:hypothetical protein